jgi:hypothetical protein
MVSGMKTYSMPKAWLLSFNRWWMKRGGGAGHVLAYEAAFRAGWKAAVKHLQSK